MRIVNDTYNARTNVRTYLRLMHYVSALCDKKKKKWKELIKLIECSDVLVECD